MKHRLPLLLVTGLLIVCSMGFILTGCETFTGGDAFTGEDALTGGDAEEAKTLHVSPNGDDQKGDGTEAKPFATVEGAIKEGIKDGISPGSSIILHEGVYDPIELTAEASGTRDNPVTITAAEGESGYETVIVKGTGKSIGIHLINVSHVRLQGFEVSGGDHGILYESTKEQGEKPLEDVSIKDCKVHDVVGTHGIAAYGANDLAPVKDFKILDCQVYDCSCGDSESVVLNGNLDGFEIAGNEIHDNNNIGIDMIGFEGTARHEEHAGFDNLYDVDFVRNGTCHDNVIYNISAEGNPAYRTAGGYDLCADGIYVDGGQNIEIDRNYVHHCDIGIEVATEHSPEDNELFKVSGVRVHDNVIAECHGWCGLCFGGYDRELGFTENCEFRNNTMIDNKVQMAVQRSKGNKIHNNLFVGEAGSAVEFSDACSPEDMVNEIGENVWCMSGETSADSLAEALPEDVMKQQDIRNDRGKVIDGYQSLIPEMGSEFVP